MKQPWYLKSNVIYSVLFFFVFSLVGSPSIWADGQTPARQQLAYAEAREKLALFFRQLKKLRATLDETDFNPTARARAIGPEIDALFRFVRDEITYEPYQGVLRFTEGTLMSRAGNAYDQSLLLAEFLRTHGYQVRFAQAHLTNEQARNVLSQTKRSSALSWRQQLVQDLNDPLIQALEPLGARDDELETEIRQANAELSAFLAALSENFELDYAVLTNRLMQAGIPLQPPGDKETRALLGEVREHCWIQVLQNSQWTDLDPSVSTLEAGQRLMAPTYLSEDLPHDLSYQLKVDVFIESIKHGKRQPPQEVLSHLAVLLKNINHMSLGIVPEFSAGSVSTQLTNPEFIRNFEVVWPVLTVNGENISGQPFNLEGEKVATDSQARLAEAIRKPLGGGTAGIGGALEDIFEQPKSSEEKAASQLNRVWMTLTLISPDGREKVLERELARRPGEATNDEQKAKNDFRRQFLSSFDILSTGSDILRQSVDARYLDYVLANRALFFTTLADSYDKPVPNSTAVLDRKVTEFPFQLLQFFYMRTALLDFNAATYFPGLVAFAAAPQVLAFRQGTKLQGDGTPMIERRFDIMWHAIRAVDPLDQEPGKSRSRDFSLQQGILDTLIEYLLLGGGEAINAHTVLAQALQDNVPLQLLKHDSSHLPAGLAVDEKIRSAIVSDLKQGFIVLTPTRPVTLSGRPAFAWWRVHPATGETLGMGSTGEGSSATEKAIQEAATVVLGSFLACGGLSYFELQPEGSFKHCLATFLVIGGSFVLASLIVGFTFKALLGVGAVGAVATVALGRRGKSQETTQPASGRYSEAGKPGRGPAESTAAAEPVTGRVEAEGRGELPAEAAPEGSRLGVEPTRAGKTSSGTSGEATRFPEETAKTTGTTNASEQTASSRVEERNLTPEQQQQERLRREQQQQQEAQTPIQDQEQPGQQQQGKANGKESGGERNQPEKKQPDLKEVLEAQYPGGKVSDPIHTTDFNGLKGIRGSGRLNAPTEGVSFSAPGVGVSRAGNVAIRVKPESIGKFIDFVNEAAKEVDVKSHKPGDPAPAGSARGVTPRFWPQGIGKGNSKSYVPLEHLQMFDRTTKTWKDIPPPAKPPK